VIITDGFEKWTIWQDCSKMISLTTLLNGIRKNG